MKKMLCFLVFVSLVYSSPTQVIDFSEIDVAGIPGYQPENWNWIAKRCKPFNNALEIGFYVNYLKEALQLEVAVETGTWQGETAKCLAFLFPTIHTIEVQFDVFKKAKNTFRNNSNVNLYQGNSPEVLSQILPSLENKRALFYLDAHWFSDWPLIAELEAIGKTHYDNCVIVIDDIKVPGRDDIPYDAYGEHECSYDYIERTLPLVFSSHFFFYLVPKSVTSRAKLVILPQAFATSLKHLSALKLQIPKLAEFLDKANKPLAGWEKAQIEEDLSFFKNRTISIEELNDFYEENSEELLLIKFTIQNNQIFADWKFERSPYQRWVFQETLSKLSELLTLPNMVFLISLHDGFNCLEDVPVFGQCKKRESYSTILIPDFEALKGRFQVLEKKDLLEYEHPWKSKTLSALIWRGGSGQGFVTPERLDKNSRVTLCKLSLQAPDLINAKFTTFCQGGENIPFLQQLGGDFPSFEEQFQYKYHILIDGNATAYTRSYWKFFSNSLIFKPTSVNFQWYFKGLEPWKHYVPVKENLKDLVEKVQWARSHDKEAEAIAKNAREFAVENLSVQDNLIYLYHVLWEYSFLKFAH